MKKIFSVLTIMGLIFPVVFSGCQKNNISSDDVIAKSPTISVKGPIYTTDKYYIYDDNEEVTCVKEGGNCLPVVEIVTEKSCIVPKETNSY